jgi:hypothetical protein
MGSARSAYHLDQAKAPQYLKEKGIRGLRCHAEYPPVADTVVVAMAVEALLSMHMEAGGRRLRAIVRHFHAFSIAKSSAFLFSN